ncbi:MAG: SulP family inorganic anion transporter [Armatimonadetes bacterium]|nr:SulP family inorganic anion transporter [Armatimonadota bacterium]
MSESDTRLRLLPAPLDSRYATGDFFGGLTAAIVALPLALGFGVASGLQNGAVHGLYGAILVGFFAALWGGTPAQVSGPTGPMTVVVAGLIVSGALDADQVFIAVALAGLLQIALGYARLGRLIQFMPYPVISGFMTGIGFIVILIELQPLLGHDSSKGTLNVIKQLPHDAAALNPAALGLGLATIAIIYLLPMITRRIPGPLAALFIVTAASAALGLQVPVIGDIPSELPRLQVAMPSLETLAVVFVPALTLALLGAIDSLLTSVVADSITRTTHDSDQELFGQGLGNFAAGLFGGLPGAGATMRTVVNIRSGGRTRLAGAIHSVVLLVILLGLGGLASHIPHAVLAGILITVGIGIIDYRGLKQMRRAPRADTVVMLLVLALTVFVDLISAVGVGVVVACLLFVKRISDISLGRYRSLHEIEGPWEDEAIPEDLKSRVFVYHLEGPFFFGTARGLRSLLDESTEPRAIILRFGHVPFVDQTSAYALEEVARDLQDRGVVLVMEGLREEPQFLLERLHVIPRSIPAENVHSDFASALRFVGSVIS